MIYVSLSHISTTFRSVDQALASQNMTTLSSPWTQKKSSISEVRHTCWLHKQSVRTRIALRVMILTPVYFSTSALKLRCMRSDSRLWVSCTHPKYHVLSGECATSISHLIHQRADQRMWLPVKGCDKIQGLLWKTSSGCKSCCSTQLWEYVAVKAKSVLLNLILEPEQSDFEPKSAWFGLYSWNCDLSIWKRNTCY